MWQRHKERQAGTKKKKTCISFVMVHRTCNINSTIVGLPWGKWQILHRKSGKNVMQCLPYKQVCVTSTQDTKETIGLIMPSTHGNSIPHKFVASVKHTRISYTVLLATASGCYDNQLRVANAIDQIWLHSLDGFVWESNQCLVYNGQHHICTISLSVHSPSLPT